MPIVDPINLLNGIQKMYETKKKAREVVTSNVLPYTVDEPSALPALNSQSQVLAEPKSSLRNAWESLTQFDTSGLNIGNLFDTERRKVGPTQTFGRDMRTEGPIERKETWSPYNPKTRYEESTPALSTVDKVLNSSQMAAFQLVGGMSLANEANRDLIGKKLVDALADKAEEMRVAGKDRWLGNKALPEVADAFLGIKYPDYHKTSDLTVKPRPLFDFFGGRRGEYDRNAADIPSPVAFDSLPLFSGGESKSLPGFVDTVAHEKLHALDDIRLPKNPTKLSPLRKEGDPLKIPYIQGSLTNEEKAAIPGLYPNLDADGLAAVTKVLEEAKYKAYREQEVERRAQRAGDTAAKSLNTVIQHLYNKKEFNTLDLSIPFEGLEGPMHNFLKKNDLLGSWAKMYDTPGMAAAAKRMKMSWADMVNTHALGMKLKDSRIPGYDRIKFGGIYEDAVAVDPMDNLWRLVDEAHAKKYGGGGVLPKK